MKIINEFLTKRLPILIIMVAILTYFSSVHLETASWIPSLLLGIVIFLTGLSMKISTIGEILTKKKEIFLVTFLKWTLTVGISIALAYTFFYQEPEFIAGIILSGTVPSATAATLYTFLAGGNTILVIAANFLDTLISPVVTLLAMMNIPGESINIAFVDLLKSFLFIVILPLSAGILIQLARPQVVTYSKNLTKFGSSLSLLLIVHIIVGNGKAAIASRIDLIPVLVLVTIIQVLLPMIAAYYIARKVGIKEEDSRAILFQVGLCNTALAAILAFDFIGSVGAIPPIINTIVNLSFGAFISNYFRNKDDRYEQNDLIN